MDVPVPVPVPVLHTQFHTFPPNSPYTVMMGLNKENVYVHVEQLRTTWSGAAELTDLSLLANQQSGFLWKCRSWARMHEVFLCS